ncbi:MAG TPA: alpha/beta hydrolase [Anaeromyxobacteraceae bacterium]
MPLIETEPGVSLHFEEAGAGPPVVLVHGWSMSSRAFAWQVEALARSRRVVAYDLRGHGRSPEPAATGRQRMEDHARDLAALLARLDLSSAALVGWSMGAQVALAALPAVAARLAALVLVAMTPRFTAAGDWPHGLPETSVRALAARVEHAPAKALRRFFDAMFVPGEVDGAQRAEIDARVLAGAPPLGAAAALAGLDALVADDERPRLGDVRVPVLLVHGERDPICLPEASAFAQSRIPGARRAVLPGVGHAPHLSRPALVNDLLARFLAEHP